MCYSIRYSGLNGGFLAYRYISASHNMHLIKPLCARKIYKVYIVAEVIDRYHDIQAFHTKLLRLFIHNTTSPYASERKDRYFAS